MAVVGGREYLGAADVARLLHVTPATVRRWAEARKLPHRRTLGGHRRFPAEQIEELVERLRGGAPAGMTIG